MQKYPVHRCRTVVAAGIVLFMLFLLSCATEYPLNIKRDTIDTPEERSVNLPHSKASPLFLILAFSGGGTRAAALSYGTLEALRSVELTGRIAETTNGSRQRTMLDEVSIIVAVSGGSFTAAYYGLRGDNIFKDYREKFLTQDVQGDLLRAFLNPFNWPRLWSPRFGRSDLAQEYYDRTLFEGVALSNMDKKNGPLIVILATDMIDGVSFPFTRETFNWICSDYSRFPVSRAVAASSAFPGPLSPVVIRNYAGSCGMEIPEWITKAPQTADPDSRAYQMAVIANTYLDKKNKPFIHLVDGGVSDNLGIRAIIDRVMVSGGIREVLDKSNISGIRRIAFIIVDAETTARPAWSIVGDIPGIGPVMELSSTVMVNKYNYETIDLLRRTIKDWQVEDEAKNKPLDFYIIHLAFNSLPEKTERDYFHSIPTSFSLQADQVDRLRDVAARLLFASPDFQRLVRDMDGNILVPAIRAPTAIDE